MLNKLLIPFACSLLLTVPLPGWATGPVGDTLREKILTVINDPPGLSKEEQYKKLAGWKTIVSNRRFPGDSINILYLQKLASLAAGQGAGQQAIALLQEDIAQISTSGIKNPFTQNALKEDYYHLGRYYALQNRFGEMIMAIDNCIDVCRNNGWLDDYYKYVLWARANYLFDIGDFDHCISYALIGEEAARRGSDTERYYNNFLNFHINSLIKLGNYSAAEKLVDANLEDSKLHARKYLINLFTQQAQILIQKGNYKQAQEKYMLGLKAEEEQGNGFSLTYFQILENIGYDIYYNHFKDAHKALSIYRQAWAYAQKKGGNEPRVPLEMLNLYANMANAYIMLNKYDTALHYYQLAFDQLSPGVNENSLMDSSVNAVIKYDRVWYLTSLITDKADAYLKYYRANGVNATLAEAIRIYKATDRLQDRLKPQQGAIKSRLFWMNDSRRLYEHAIEASYLSHSMEDAFYFFEKSRAVMLNEQLNEQYLIRNEDILQVSMLERMAQLKERDTLIKDEALREERDNLTIRLDKLKKSIQEKYPLYYQSFLDTSFVKPSDVRKKLLNDHQSLLELFEGDSAVYVLLVTPQKITLRKAGKADFDITVRDYLALLANLRILNLNFNTYTSLSNHLYHLIFGDEPPPAGRMIISPGGPYFPFEPMVINGDPSSPQYFLYDHAVSYTYSARYLLNNFNQDSSTHNTFLGIAPVHFNEPDLPLLTGSDVSLNVIRSNFHSADNLVSSEATRNNFLHQFYKYRIIQLYAHASDTSINDEPVIHFADSALFLSDLLPESKPLTRLVVLSACKTGNGKYYRGEGVFSFNRAFAALGIPSAVTNLWSVEDKATYGLTELFYQNVAQGDPLDIALQKAKKQFIASNGGNELPFFWSAAVLIGKTDQLVYKEEYPWKLLIAILISALVIGTSIWRYRGRLFPQKVGNQHL